MSDDGSNSTTSFCIICMALLTSLLFKATPNIFISLSMNGNSIGSESLSGYNDFIKICSNKFYLNGAVEILKNEDINSNYHKDKIRSDFFLWGIKK